MDPDLRELLTRLLDQRVLSLGVLIDGAPYVGLLPFARTADGGGLLVHASNLARHSRGLGDGADYSALLFLPEAAERDPLQVPRLTLTGRVARLERDSEECERGRAIYLARFPESARTFQLGDFNLYELRIDKGRLVAGFARTANLGPTDFAAS